MEIIEMLEKGLKRYLAEQHQNIEKISLNSNDLVKLGVHSYKKIPLISDDELKEGDIRFHFKVPFDWQETWW